MLLNLQPEALARMRIFTLRAVGTLAALLLAWILVQIVRSVPWAAGSSMTASGFGTVEAVGRLLFTTYLLPFELTSFIILAAIIGTVTLAKREPHE